MLMMYQLHFCYELYISLMCNMHDELNCVPTLPQNNHYIIIIISHLIVFINDWIRYPFLLRSYQCYFNGIYIYIYIYMYKQNISMNIEIQK